MKSIATKTRIKAGKEGFTLIEVIAVLVILGVLAAVAIPKYIDLQSDAEERAIDAGVSELNGRENLFWAQTKLTTGGWTSDAALFAAMATTPEPDAHNLGGDYTWSAGPTVTGGTLQFGGATGPEIVLARVASEVDQPGVWTR